VLNAFSFPLKYQMSTSVSIISIRSALFLNF
jgi:hypothetical protein